MTPSVRWRGHLTATHSIRRSSIRRRSIFVDRAQVAIPVVGRVGHAATVARIGRGVAAVHTVQEEARANETPGARQFGNQHTVQEQHVLLRTMGTCMQIERKGAHV